MPATMPASAGSRSISTRALATQPEANPPMEEGEAVFIEVCDQIWTNLKK